MVSIYESSITIPGERLGSVEEFSPGNGTYIRHGYVYASLTGFKQVLEHGEGQVSISLDS